MAEKAFPNNQTSIPGDTPIPMKDVTPNPQGKVKNARN